MMARLGWIQMVEVPMRMEMPGDTGGVASLMILILSLSMWTWRSTW